MHIFVIHQFPDLDNFAPIIYKLSEKSKDKAIILSVYPIYDFKKLPPTPSNYQIARKSQPQLKKKLLDRHERAVI